MQRTSKEHGAWSTAELAIPSLDLNSKLDWKTHAATTVGSLSFSLLEPDQFETPQTIPGWMSIRGALWKHYTAAAREEQ
jgi:hypothetical protein